MIQRHFSLSRIVVLSILHSVALYEHPWFLNCHLTHHYLLRHRNIFTIANNATLLAFGFYLSINSEISWGKIPRGRISESNIITYLRAFDKYCKNYPAHYLGQFTILPWTNKEFSHTVTNHEWHQLFNHAWQEMRNISQFLFCFNVFWCINIGG